MWVKDLKSRKVRMQLVSGRRSRRAGGYGGRCSWEGAMGRQACKRDRNRSLIDSVMRGSVTSITMS